MIKPCMDKNEQLKQRAKLYRHLGKLPHRRRKIKGIRIYEDERLSYVLEKWIFDFNGLERVPAYFLKSKKVKGKAPVILYNHSHGGNYGVGKEEVLNGAAYLQQPSYGEALTEEGYHVFCIDTWGFGERSGRTESELFKEMLWKGQVLWGMMVYDSLRAIDYLTTRTDVDPNRIGTLGMSMGSTMAWWLAALDERIKVTIDICCLTDFQSLLEEKGLDRHGLYYYVPNLFTNFTTAQINALIAPRPHLSLAGTLDPLTPVRGLSIIDREMKREYLGHGMEHAWKLQLYNVGHEETSCMRVETLSFLKEWL